MRISDWSSDVCSSDLIESHLVLAAEPCLAAQGFPAWCFALLCHSCNCRSALSAAAEAILGNLPVNVARPQHRAGKAWVVRRVGEALGFEAQPGTGTVLSGIEHVSVIELQGRFGRRDLQRDAGPRTGQPGNRPDTAEIGNARCRERVGQYV